MSDESTQKTASGSGASPSGRPLDGFKNGGFIACVALLAVFAFSFDVLVTKKGVQFRKEALPLRKPLENLDQSQLAPYRLLRPSHLQQDMVNQLGTDQYVLWLMANPYRSDGTLRDIANHPDWAKPSWPWRINFFVTYYTGTPDAVPHVPETCYAGSGHQLTRQSPDEVIVPMGDDEIVVPIQVLEFEKAGELVQNRRVVIYTFHANGAFRADRTAVRRAVSFPSSRYAYFSKLEVSLDIGAEDKARDEAVASSKRFLQTAIPVLLNDHWPDWEKANQAATTETTATGDNADQDHRDQGSP